MSEIFYDSTQYEYIPEIVCEVNIRAKMENSKKQTIRTEKLVVESMKVYDHDKYLQFNIKIKDTLSQTNIKSILFGNFSTQAYGDVWSWVSFKILPNKNTQNAYMYIFSLTDAHFIDDIDAGALSLCAVYDSLGVTPDNKETWYPHTKFNYIIEYDTISKEETSVVEEKLRQHNSSVFTNDKKKGIFASLFKSNKLPPEKKQLNSLVEGLHMTEQERQIFDPEMLSVSYGTTNSQEALNRLIGLDNVKTEVEKLKAKLQYRQKQKSRNIFVESEANMHMCFTGSPGTGKTTVARIITGILYEMGYIKSNMCVEVNGQNLKGGYTGHTAIITKLVLKSAKNKVLFIDEAYALFDNYEGGYGKEAVATILKHMEDERDNTIVIFAGYKDDMEEFLRMNDGLKSRINRYIHFKNYTPAEMLDIFLSNLKSKKLYITKDAVNKCMLAFKKATISDRFSNGRFVRNMVEKIEYEHAFNTHDTKDSRRQDTVELEDIPDSLITELLTRSM